MKAFVVCSFLLFFFLPAYSQVAFTYFNKDHEVVKERKAFYFTNQYFEGKGKESVVLTPMAGGEKSLATFLDGNFQSRKPYTGESNNPFFKEFDSEGVLYSEKEVYAEVDLPPAPVGGKLALKEFATQNKLVYPKEAMRAGIQGRVFVAFVVTATGEVVDIQIAKGTHELLNAEALRWITELGQKIEWKPGLVDGKPVAARVIMPV